MTEESIEVVRALYDAFARRDMPAALATLADDIEWHETGGRYAGAARRGHDAIVDQVFGPSINEIENLCVTPEQTFDAGDTVAVIHRYTGTVKATGKPLDRPASASGTYTTARSRPTTNTQTATSGIRRFNPAEGPTT